MSSVHMCNNETPPILKDMLRRFDKQATKTLANTFLSPYNINLTDITCDCLDYQ